MSTATERAWAAGFFDGEGTTICFIGRSGQRSLQMSAVQLELAPLERFHAAVDGLGNISSPSKQSGVSPWRAYGPTALAALALIEPFLSEPKREQALKAKITYVLRRIIDPERCRRGHRYDEAGIYQPPNGSRECLRCRRATKAGRSAELPPKRFPTALELGWGVREYDPPFGIDKAEDYRPLVET